MLKRHKLALLMMGVALPTYGFAADEAPPLTTEVIVSATRPTLPVASNIDLNNPALTALRDAASMVELAPGAAVAHNGLQSGILQLRGLSQDRVKVRLDGMEVTPACPNHMDPPMHYVVPGEVAQLQVLAGITSVVNGGDSIAGTVNVNTRSVTYSNDGTAQFSGDVKSKYLGANNGLEANLDINLGLKSTAMRYVMSLQSADDLHYADNRVAALTGYNTERQQFEIETRFGVHTLGVAAGRHRSRDVGTAALGMDMIVDDASNMRMGYRGKIGFLNIDARYYDHTIDHVMDNYSLRTYTATASRMRAPASSRDRGFGLDFTYKVARTIVSFGADGHSNLFDVYQQNVTSGMTRDLFVNAKRDRLGLYIQWDAHPSETLRTLIGIRSETVKAATGDIVRVMMMGENSAKAAFNGLDRSVTDTNFDAMASLRWHMNDQVSFEVGIAQKTRSPGLVERYLWTASSTYGSADGRNYLGNTALKPEVSQQISLAASLTSDKAYIRPAVFFNRVNGYIQGVAVSTALDATLRFENIDAELYGFEASFGYAFSSQWALAGQVSYVRGQDKTFEDNLYRIAPLRGSLVLNYQNDRLKGALEIRASASQKDVSAYNAETVTKGYALTHLRGEYHLSPKTAIRFGVENIFDTDYADHLSGRNRVDNAALGGDLAMNTRLPGTGRYGYVALSFGW